MVRNLLPLFSLRSPREGSGLPLRSKASALEAKGIEMPNLKHHEGRRKAIRDALSQGSAGLPGKVPAVDAALNLWHQMEAHLTPIVGERGCDALFGRSFQLTATTFPWLSSAERHVDDPAPLRAFRACQEAQDPASGSEASFFLLATFTELLASMIGESLTDRILAPVWASSPLRVEQENSS